MNIKANGGNFNGLINDESFFSQKKKIIKAFFYYPDYACIILLAMNK